MVTCAHPHSTGPDPTADGFAPWRPPPGFGNMLTALYRKELVGAVALRIVVANEHCNAYGVAHGGFLATFADVALAHGIAAGLPANVRLVTANLDIAYLRAAPVGTLLESHVERLTSGARLVTARGVLFDPDGPIADVRGLFARLHDDGPVAGT